MKTISRSQLTIALFASSALIAPAALADNFTVSTPSTVTNGAPGNVLNGNDNLTITNTGSITVNNSHGVEATGTGDTISNSGKIVINGDFIDGVRGGTNTSITNSGTIISNGGLSWGIFGGANNTLVNSGTITTFKTSSGAVYLDNDSTMVNSGTITTSGTVSNGIFSAARNIITNTGEVTTHGAGSNGVRISGDDNTFINSGTIQALGSGANSNGVLITSAGSTFRNSGKVVSTNGSSFNFTGGDNTLFLTAPSFIGGRMNLLNSDLIDVTTGASHSVLWDFSTNGLNFNFAGSVPWAWNAATRQFATYDPTAFSAAPETLAQLSGLLSNVMQQRLERGTVSATGSNLNAFAKPSQSKGSTRIDNAFETASSTYDDVMAPEGWISVIGSGSNYDGNKVILDHSLVHWGIVGGYDWSPSEDLKFGVMAGYNQGTLKASSRFTESWDNKTSGFFAGAYGRKTMGTHFLDFALTGGTSDHSDKRLINDNLALLGVSTASSSYDDYWISPEIAIGSHYDIGNGWQASPTARLRYASQWLDGYSETGPSAANAVVGSRQVAVGEASLEWAMTRKTEKSDTTLRLGYLFRTSMGDDATNVTMIGQIISVPTFDEDQQAVYFGANTDIKINDMVHLQFGARATLAQGHTGVGGSIKLVSTF